MKFCFSFSEKFFSKMLRAIVRPFLANSNSSLRQFPRFLSSTSALRTEEPTIPPYLEKFNEPLEEKRSRLIYQSRKRGILENGLLLATFADKNLKDFNHAKKIYVDSYAASLKFKY